MAEWTCPHCGLINLASKPKDGCGWCERDKSASLDTFAPTNLPRCPIDGCRGRVVYIQITNKRRCTICGWQERKR